MRFATSTATLLAFLVAVRPAALYAQLVCPGTAQQPARQLSVRTAPGGSAPYVDLGLAGVSGPWLIDYGATASSISHHSSPAPAPGTQVSRAGFTMPFANPGAQNFWYYPRDIRVPGVGVQRGVVGTDLLKDMIGEFHYENAHAVSVAFSNTPCPTPGGAFWSISQEGYFGTNPRLRASHIPNVPVVFVEWQDTTGALAGARTFAQIDPGFDDVVWRHTIAVNERLFARLDTLSPRPVKLGEIQTTNCLGQTIRPQVYALPERELRIEDQTGAWMWKTPAFYVVRYPDEPPGTCNGITTMPEPAAQLGASFLRTFGTTVIHPEVRRDAQGRSIGEVWIRMPQQPPALP
jgi:hypothetical protein